MKIPRISVVIPTVDRGHLLGGAIESALAQTEPDLEVVVVDNGSTDDTPIVARATGDARVRYVRRAERRPMHESWRYAIAQARGTFVTVLCDDDALHPGALGRAADLADDLDADVVAWRVATHSYVFDRASGDHIRGRVHFGPPYADRPLRIDGACLVDLAFELRVTFTDLVPKLLNAIVARPLLDRISEARGVPFPPSACPDYSAMLGLAARARGLVLLDAPLTVAGAGPDSIGASAYRRGRVSRDFLAELSGSTNDLVRPAALGPRITWLAQTLMQCAAADYAFAGREVDPVNLYGLAGLEIADAERDGVDVARERADFEAALAGPLAAHAGAVRDFMTEHREIACESYLSAVPDGEAVLGLGVFRAGDAPARAIGGDRTADVAAGMDGWLSREADRLAPTLASYRARAGDRGLVLFGLGRNGRALRRAWRDGRTAAIVDEHMDRVPPGVERLGVEDLDPRRHFVVVTPCDAAPIVSRLQERGFVPDADVASLVTQAMSAGSGRIGSHGAGPETNTPPCGGASSRVQRGCRSDPIP